MPCRVISNNIKKKRKSDEKIGLLFIVYEILTFTEYP